MASKSLLITIAYLVVFCFMIMKSPATDCVFCGHYGRFFAEKAGFSESYNRKVLGGIKVIKKYSTGNELNGWELRKVPSGPDPLHHNGKTPKKPRSP